MDTTIAERLAERELVVDELVALIARYGIETLRAAMRDVEKLAK